MKVIEEVGRTMNNTFEQVYAIVRNIPCGMVATYGGIARMLGNPRLSRVVGYAMSGCPYEDVPCHRVVNRFGGFSDAFLPAGKDTQRMLLEMEGVPITEDGLVDLGKCLWQG